jgi:hypothetical protein
MAWHPKTDKEKLGRTWIRVPPQLDFYSRSTVIMAELRKILAPRQIPGSLQFGPTSGKW